MNKNNIYIREKYNKDTQEYVYFPEVPGKYVHKDCVYFTYTWSRWGKRFDITTDHIGLSFCKQTDPYKFYNWLFYHVFNDPVNPNWPDILRLLS